MSNKFVDKLLVEKTYVVGIFEDDDIMLKALKELKDENYIAKDAFLPFPVHGIDHVMNIKRSRIGIAAFIFGALGASLALLMQTYMMYIDWPMNIGGKPVLPIPAFIPITFEVTVLFSALGMSAVYFMRSHLIPGFEPKIYDKRQTSDRFVVLYDVEAGERDKIKRMLEERNAIEVREETVKEPKSGFPLPFKY